MKTRPNFLIEVLLWPFAILYVAVIALRNFFYDHGFVLIEGVAPQVLSIGNLTAGGTGKTPLTALLVRGFLAYGKKVGVVSRGYGGTASGSMPARVLVTGTELASKFGDEPTWLAREFPNVPVVISAKRVAAAKLMADDDNVDLIIADDAFQHRKLRRLMDVVVIDASEPRWHYRPLPVGRMREGFSALSRAHAIFITKTNLAAAEDLDWLRARVKKALARFEVPPFIFEATSVIPSFTRLGGSELAPDLRDRSCLLISAIGRPHTFRKLVEETGAKVSDHLEYRDHHAYVASDIQAINERAVALKVDAIVMTEKDAVKFDEPSAFSVPAYVSRLEMRVVGGSLSIEDFYEAFDRAVF